MKEAFLETERLVIYRSAPDFFEELYRLLSDEEVMRYIGGRALSRSEIEERLNTCIAHWKRHGFSLGFVFEKISRAFVGRAGLVHLAYDDNQPDIEVGYILLKPFWGKGHATELARALIAWGFAHLQIESLIGVTDPQNLPSERVLKKVGMHFEKIAPYPFHGKESHFFRCLK